MKKFTAPILLTLLATVLMSGSLILSSLSTGHAKSLGDGSQRRVAVLEFQNISRDREFSWLGLTVPETLTTKLNAVRSISLIERVQINKIYKDCPPPRGGGVLFWRIRYVSSTNKK